MAQRELMDSSLRVSGKFTGEPGLSAERKQDVWDNACALLLWNCGLRMAPPGKEFPIAIIVEKDE